MKQERIKTILKTPFFKWFLPVSMTAISVCFWIKLVELNFLDVIGAIINTSGLIVWWVAKITLAKNWNLGFGKLEIGQLVTHGIYSKFSHPMYWGINLTFLGLILIYPIVWFIVISLFVIIYFFSRMRLENKYLLKTLGKEYLDYKSKTWI